MLEELIVYRRPSIRALRGFHLCKGGVVGAVVNTAENIGKGVAAVVTAPVDAVVGIANGQNVVQAVGNAATKSVAGSIEVATGGVINSYTPPGVASLPIVSNVATLDNAAHNIVNNNDTSSGAQLNLWRNVAEIGAAVATAGVASGAIGASTPADVAGEETIGESTIAAGSVEDATAQAATATQLGEETTEGLTAEAATVTPPPSIIEEDILPGSASAAGAAPAAGGGGILGTLGTAAGGAAVAVGSSLLSKAEQSLAGNLGSALGFGPSTTVNKTVTKPGPNASGGGGGGGGGLDGSQKANAMAAAVLVAAILYKMR